MMRSLWTAASGMMSQQTSVDTIANNLANVNTIGYKQEQTQFKSLLYQNLQAKTTSANGDDKPVGAQVGLGSRVSAPNINITLKLIKRRNIFSECCKNTPIVGINMGRGCPGRRPDRCSRWLLRSRSRPCTVRPQCSGSPRCSRCACQYQCTCPRPLP